MSWSARRARLLERHRPPARAPLVVRAGGRVKTGELSEEWPAFRWCIDRNLICGWMPDRYLEPGASEEAIALRAYDTTELAADADEIVTVIEADDESGWLWCRSSSGAAGWIPVSSLEPYS